MQAFTMHAFLIVGGIKQAREQAVRNRLDEWHVGLFDRVDLKTETGSIGIEDVRQFQRRFILAPHESPISVGIIHDADLLTPQAQQALLKTLEEPPPRAKIILETMQTHSLLPTVISRCTVTDLGISTQFSKEEILECLKTLKLLQKSSVSQRLRITATIAKTREEANAWVDLALIAGRELMLAGNSSTTDLLRNLIRARSQLSANVNPQLTLDIFALVLS